MDECRRHVLHVWVSVGGVPDGAPGMVMVHGVGVSQRYMLPIAERRALFCRVFAPDLAGFGKSDKATRILSVTELADAPAAQQPLRAPFANAGDRP